MNKNLTSAQQQLLKTAQEAFSSGKKEAALALAQALLQSAPASLEARKLARQAARQISSQQKENFWEAFCKKIRAFFILRKVKLMIEKKEPAQALLLLEKLLGSMPNLVVAHRCMATVALNQTPPLHTLALFSMKEAIALVPDNIFFQLELANVALLSTPTGKACDPQCAFEVYQHILSIDPSHLKAQAGLKNAAALLSIQENRWL